jgi:hypothetical protein
MKASLSQITLPRSSPLTTFAERAFCRKPNSKQEMASPFAGTAIENFTPGSIAGQTYLCQRMLKVVRKSIEWSGYTELLL